MVASCPSGTTALTSTALLVRFRLRSPSRINEVSTAPRTRFRGAPGGGDPALLAAADILRSLTGCDLWDCTKSCGAAPPRCPAGGWIDPRRARARSQNPKIRSPYSTCQYKLAIFPTLRCVRSREHSITRNDMRGRKSARRKKLEIYTQTPEVGGIAADAQRMSRSSAERRPGRAPRPAARMRQCGETRCACGGYRRIERGRVSANRGVSGGSRVEVVRIMMRRG